MFSSASNGGFALSAPITARSVPYVYGRNVPCVGVPVAWRRSGPQFTAQWDVWAIISAGAVSGISAIGAAALLEVDDEGQLDASWSGLAPHRIPYNRHTLARVLTSEDPACCWPRFTVAEGRKVPELLGNFQRSATVINAVTHQSATVGSDGQAPIAIRPNDNWLIRSGIPQVVEYAPDILADLLFASPGLTAEVMAWDWDSLRLAKEWAVGQGYNLRGQYFGQYPYVRLAMLLAIQSGCNFWRSGGQMGMTPETSGPPVALYTPANTKAVRFERPNYDLNNYNRVISRSLDWVCDQSLPDVASGKRPAVTTEMPSEWIADVQSGVQLQALWLDSIRTQDLEVRFLATDIESQARMPGDLIQVVHPLWSREGERSGYVSGGVPNWADGGSGTQTYQRDGQWRLGTPTGDGTYPAAISDIAQTTYRVTEVCPVDRVATNIRAVIRPRQLGNISLTRDV